MLPYLFTVITIPPALLCLLYSFLASEIITSPYNFKATLEVTSLSASALSKSLSVYPLLVTCPMGRGGHVVNSNSPFKDNQI